MWSFVKCGASSTGSDYVFWMQKKKHYRKRGWTLVAALHKSSIKCDMTIYYAIQYKSDRNKLIANPKYQWEVNFCLLKRKWPGKSYQASFVNLIVGQCFVEKRLNEQCGHENFLAIGPMFKKKCLVGHISINSKQAKGKRKCFRLSADSKNKPKKQLHMFDHYMYHSRNFMHLTLDMSVCKCEIFIFLNIPMLS